MLTIKKRTFYNRIVNRRNLLDSSLQIINSIKVFDHTLTSKLLKSFIKSQDVKGYGVEYHDPRR